MANKFELGSKEFQIPSEVEKHYDEEEFEAAQEMYGANDYDEGKDDPVTYKSKNEVSEETEKKILEFKNKKIGSSVFSFINRVA